MFLKLKLKILRFRLQANKNILIENVSILKNEVKVRESEILSMQKEIEKFKILKKDFDDRCVSLLDKKFKLHEVESQIEKINLRLFNIETFSLEREKNGVQ